MLWKIPVTWEMCAFARVEAETLEDAMKIAKDEDSQIPLPHDGSYVDGSWDLSCTDLDVLKIYQESPKRQGDDAE